MYTADIEIAKKNKIIEATALMDTGFTGGLLIPTYVAKELGATLVKVKSPKMLDGRAIPGKGTVLEVRFTDAEVAAETLVFCPTADQEEILIGAFLLETVDARIVIGKSVYGPPMKKNPSKRLDVNDIGDWILPIRPITKWW